MGSRKQKKSEPIPNREEKGLHNKKAAKQTIVTGHKREPLPKTPEVKRMVKDKNAYCSLKKGFETNPKCFEMRCCAHRNETKQRSAAHELVCTNCGHQGEVWKVPDHVLESEKESEEEILLTSSESEEANESKEEVGDDPSSGSDWDMEETAANQDSLSAYKFMDDETEPHELCEASHTRDLPYVSTYAPRRKRTEIDYDSEDDFRYGTLYKRDKGEANAYQMPEVPQDVVFPGARPKVRARVPEEEGNSDDDEDE